MKRKLVAVLFVIYSIIAITVTVLLLSFNEYNCSEIGGNTVYLVNNDAFEPEYEQGSILIIESTSDKHIQVGDEILLYKVYNSQEFEVISKKLVSKSQQGRHIVYTVEGGESYDSSYFIGKKDDVTVIGAPWGTILSILESKWGYLFCIVIVSLLLFLQEVFDLIIEIKYGGGKTAKKGTSTAKATTTKKTGTTATKTATASKAATATKKVATVAKANNTETGVKEES